MSSPDLLGVEGDGSVVVVVAVVVVDVVVVVAVVVRAGVGRGRRVGAVHRKNAMSMDVVILFPIELYTVI